MTTETIQISISDKTAIEVEPGHGGSVDLKLMAKPTPDASWQFAGGVLLDKGLAEALAMILLEKAGSTHMLMKKYRPAE